MLKLPNYIKNANINVLNVNYEWKEGYFGDENKKPKNLSFIISQIEPLTFRAKLIIATGIYEWILGRFDGFVDLPEDNNNILDCAWCVSISRYYSSWETFIENIDYEFENGPIIGLLADASYVLNKLLWVSTNIEQPIGYDFHDGVDPVYLFSDHQWEITISTLYCLITHILPKDKTPIFQAWLDGVIERLLKYYKEPEEHKDPFFNLFGEESDLSWLGDYVARESLDLNFDYKPEGAKHLLEQYLRQVDYKDNPYLRPPEELTHVIPHPYQSIDD